MDHFSLAPRLNGVYMNALDLHPELCPAISAEGHHRCYTPLRALSLNWIKQGGDQSLKKSLNFRISKCRFGYNSKEKDARIYPKMRLIPSDIQLPVQVRPAERICTHSAARHT